MTPPKTLEKIGRYKVLDRVGKGGMGVLYRGFDPVLDREVAIKLMHADFSEDTEQMRPRFYREARAAAKLNHRNIVTIFEFAEESNVPYIVMEFLRGTPLTSRINGSPPLTLDDKLNVVGQLLDGLSYAHEQGVVHRDVKPDNIFILEDGSVKLLDFGIAKLTSSTLTRQGDVLGSASYMSPEQVGGSEAVDGRADLFSTGVVLYELLCGRKPFEGDSPTAVIIKILKEDPTPIETYSPNLPPDIVAAVMKALSKDPNDRFQTADAFCRELQSIRKGLHPSTSIPRLDETRFASTQVMKALHEDFQKSRANKPPTAAGGRPAVHDDELTRAATLAAAAARPAWMMPAAVGGALVVVALIGLLAFRGRPESPSAPPANTTATTPTTTASTGTTAPSGDPTATTATGSSPTTATSAAGTTTTSPTTATTTPAGGTTAAAGTGTTTAAPPPPARMVNATFSGNYAFEILDGNRSLSRPAASHTLKLPAGRPVRVQAPQHYLSQNVRVEGSASQPFEWEAPGLGSLEVRSSQETCDVQIGTRKVGNPPLKIADIAAGSYKVDIVCNGDIAQSRNVVIQPGQTFLAIIR